MTEIEDDWLTTTPAEPLESDQPLPQSSRRLLAVRAGLVAAGAIVGGVVVASISHGGSSTTAGGFPTAAIGAPGSGQFPGNGQLPGPGNSQPGTDPFAAGPGGGLSGEQRLSGSLVSVGSSAVTVKTSAGTSTYTVTSSSEIVRNGQVVALSALKPGDDVYVHVYPTGSGARLTVERLFATGSTGSGTKT